MPPTNLPAHLQNQQVPNLTARALEGLGSAMPPHISIQGNTFTLIDASGNDQPMGPTLDACIIDMADVICKRFYKNDWTPGSDDPPACFSMNGIAPSREAIEPQSPTCASCPNNVRGSEVSKLSGKPIKACRDEKPMALLIPQYPNMLFQLVLTPGSFKNWSAYMKQFEQHQVNLADVLTRFSFQNKANGVLEFRPAERIWIDAPTAEARGKALAAKATDLLVGRLDKPIQGALIAPTGSASPNHSPAVGGPVQHAGETTANPAFGGAQQPQGSSPNGGATTAAPSDGRKRRGRPAAQQGQETTTQQPAGNQQGNAFQPAPFRPNPAPEQGGQAFGASAGPSADVAPAGGGGFGIQSATAPNPELQAALKGVFGQ